MNSSFIKLPQSMTTTAPRTGSVAAIPPKSHFRLVGDLIDLIASATARPQQKITIAQAALLIGTCRVAAADTQTTSEENQVLKSSQVLAGIQKRHLHHSFC